MRSNKTWLTALYLAVAVGLGGVSGAALADGVYIIRDHSPGYYAGEYYRPHNYYRYERRYVRPRYTARPRVYNNTRRYSRGGRGGGWFPALVGGVIGYHLND